MKNDEQAARSELAPQLERLELLQKAGSQLNDALLLKADLFDYLCWLELKRTQQLPDSAQGTDYLCLASDGTTCWGKTYGEAVQIAKKYEETIFDDKESTALSASSNNGRASEGK